MPPQVSQRVITRQMKVRTIGLSILVVGAVIFVFWYSRRERAAELAAAEASASSSGSSSTSTSGSAAAEKIRKIEKPRRDALLERMRVARAARTSGGASTSAGSTPRPALPALPGMINKDDIRAGVRAVIPLLAECYDNAQDRLTTKAGKIVVQMHLTGEPDVGTLIESAEIGGDAHFTSDAELVECFQQTLLSVEQPPIAGGGTIDVTYPIEFAPND